MLMDACMHAWVQQQHYPYAGEADLVASPLAASLRAWAAQHLTSAHPAPQALPHQAPGLPGHPTLRRPGCHLRSLSVVMQGVLEALHNITLNPSTW